VEIVITTEKSLTDELAHVLQAHWLFCTSTTPIEHVYALEASKLFTSDITVFGVRVSSITYLDISTPKLSEIMF
jgi:hypothetical protein